MKHQIINILLIALLIMAFPFKSSGKDKEIDFNFPQDVTKEAISDLNKAMKAGDGQQTVDALIRFSLAQSAISQDNMPEIIKRIEATIAKEKQPHIRALLYHLEAMAFEGYRDRYARWSNRQNPEGELPADYSEWDRKQLNNKILDLIKESLADYMALEAVSVTSLPDIIKCNELGATYIPTLHEFLLMKSLELIDDDEDEYEAFQLYAKKLRDRWVSATMGNVPAHLYALSESGRSISLEDYQKYQDNEFSALLLNQVSIYNNKEEYKILKAYVERFPNSIFTNNIKNKIIRMEEKSVNVSYPETCSSRDSIQIKVDVENTNSFNINVYRVPDDLLDEYRYSLSDLKLVRQHPMTVQGSIPFTTNNIKASLPPLPYGVYILYGEIPGKVENQNIKGVGNYDILRVTDMALISISHKDQNDRIGAVDLNTGKPLADVTVEYRWRSDIAGTVGNTGADGFVNTPKQYKNPEFQGRMTNFDGLSIHAFKGEDKYSPWCNFNRIRSYEHAESSGNIYTDLGVYRPGETVKWATIAYYTDNDHRTPLDNTDLEVIFLDKNREPIDTIKGKTDVYGRLEGSFVVPTDRMNGMFLIVVNKMGKSGSESQLAREYVNVSEYKTPTFEVSFPDAQYSYTIGQPVKVTGKAETYSGMPVANTRVRLSLIKQEWNWRWWYSDPSNGTHLMDTTVTTDAQGMFSFSYDPKLFTENQSRYYRWARDAYQVVATVTTDAGETHEESTSFIVGTRRGIELGSNNNNIYLNDKPIKLPLRYNTTDEQVTSTWCTWQLVPMGSKEPVKTGNLNTADPTVDWTDLPSGQYQLTIHILDAEEGEQDVDVVRDIVLYRKTDKQAPIKDTPLWIPPTGLSVDKNNVGHITVGVSVPKAYIYYVATAGDKVLGEGWLNYARGFNDFAIALPKEPGANLTVQFVTYYGTKVWNDTEYLTNPYKAESLNITATSFRDKLTPGDIEHWTFTLTDQNGKPRCGAMLLDMFDKALASIAENEWNYYSWRPYYHPASLNVMSLGTNNYVRNSWQGVLLQTPPEMQPFLPELYTYGYYLFSRSIGVVHEVELLGASARYDKRALARPMEKGLEENSVAMMTDQAFGAVEEEATGEQPQVNEANLEKVTLRENDVKTALWQPLLTSDERGNISVEFEVPNFNTTWITQAVAWDKDMHGSTWMAEVLTQKPLMVRSSMPRFLRQGDKARLAATVQNATDQPAACDAVIELFDPRTGEIFATRNFNLQLDPKGSQSVTIDWVVPDTISMTGFRIKATNGRYGDGEQVMVPVLTTISPVIETQPFYIEAATSHFETALPEFPADARVTLEYCDNPVWYCVLALPTIFSDNYSVATHAAHSLFALQVAQGVAKMQPQIKEAVTYWKEHEEDSTLISMLQKNQDLKIGTLLASPWMREADRQTLRMSKLHELFDDAIVQREYEKIIEALQSLQMPDGGFTWFRYPECESNIWTTGAVLELIGEIKHLGYLPEDERLTSMLNRALKYYDDGNVIRLREAMAYEKEPYALFIDYAYTRSLYPEVKLSNASANLMKKTLKFMDKNWNKGITLKEKAYYALTLNRNGYHKTAGKIIESIRQFAIVKPSTGMYWDNLQTGYGWWELDKVAYTCTILQAMHEVDPNQPEIDQVRKWMLLMKQSNDWGSCSLASDAVYSILKTGSPWLERNVTPAITVAGQPVNLDKMAEWLGYFRTTLPATTGNVVIDRSGNGPAWGAVYSQFKSPMTQVKEKAIDEVSISKEYYVYGQDGSLRSATSFKVGDKVKVRVIIKNNKDMDFVTLTDERASCFEPVDQLSGYQREDRTWFYQETKDSQTNMFFSSLNKGTHIIGYDVWVTNPGEFTSGIATIQCQYAPQLSAHSAGKTIMVE